MSYLELENFKFGLETRKSEMTANPGSLLTCNNAHINQGGEVEKRRAFFPQSSAFGGLGLLNTGESLGLEFSDYYSGAVTFGTTSLAVPGLITAAMTTNTLIGDAMKVWLDNSNSGVLAVVNIAGAVTMTNLDGTAMTVTVTKTSAGTATITNNGTTAVTVTFGGTWSTNDRIKFAFNLTTMPSVGYGVGPMAVYPSLGAVSLSNGGGTSVATARMTLSDPFDSTAVVQEIVHSCQFQGKPFVIAGFSSGRYLPFYDGVPLGDWWAGVIHGDFVGSSATVITKIRDAIISWINTQAGPYGYSTAISTSSKLIVSNSSGFSGNITITYVTTTAAGVVTIAGSPGTAPTIDISGTWADGDTITITLSRASITTRIGSTDLLQTTSVTVTTPLFCFPFGDKVYVLSDKRIDFSEIGYATSFSQPGGASASGTGNGSITFARSNAIAAGHYQGKVAIFFRHFIQIWTMDANPDNNALSQEMENIGIVGRQALVSIGDLDIIFVSDTGVRSLRSRDLSLNAMVVDIGSPIDSLIRAKLNAKTCNRNLVCLGYEPIGGRVFLSIGYSDSAYSATDDSLTYQLYILSYYPQARIVAWSTYDVTWGFWSASVVTQTAFSIQSMRTWRGTLFMRGKDFAHSDGLDSIFTYDPSRISTRTTYAVAYDNCPVIVKTPWLSGNKPGTNKSGLSVEAVSSGKWVLSATMDPVGGAFAQVGSFGSTTPNVETDSTASLPQSCPYNGFGNYFQLKATTNEPTATPVLVAGPPVLSSFIFHYQSKNEKP